MAIELSNAEWKLGFTVGLGQAPRYLTTLGVTNLVVDSASIEVNRRRRRVKTDRLNVGKLLMMLVRYFQGEKKVWSVLHPPARRKKTSASCTANGWRSSASGPGTSTASKACWPVRG
jgi:hypothetical protein